MAVDYCNQCFGRGRNDLGITCATCRGRKAYETFRQFDAHVDDYLAREFMATLDAADAFFATLEN